MPQPGWPGAGGSADLAWNRVQLGSYVLPGVCTVTGLEVGQALDVKKQKGNDGAVLEDNGLDPAKFNIEVQFNEELWPAFQEVLPKIDPRRPGAARSPLEIVHPLTSFLNIREIVVRKVRPSPPSARGGMKWVLECIQWFAAPKPKKTGAVKNAADASVSFDDPAKLRAWELTQASHFDLIGAEAGRPAEQTEI
ncbi:MAG: hypothetical protein DIU78_020420 [Pseudomonadota bacterium]